MTRREQYAQQLKERLSAEEVHEIVETLWWAWQALVHPEVQAVGNNFARPVSVVSDRACRILNHIGVLEGTRTND